MIQGIVIPKRPTPALVLFALLLVASCSPAPIALDQLPGGVQAFRQIETDPPQHPVNPAFRSLRLPDYEQRLAQVRVRVSTWISFVTTEPEPLFTDTQKFSIAKVMAREMPNLAPTQRLLFQFSHHARMLPVEMVVYLDGDHLVFRFPELVRYQDATLPGNNGTNMARLAAGDGQRAELTHGVPVLWDRVFGQPAPSETLSQATQAMLQAARTSGRLTDSETAELTALLQKRPAGAEERRKNYLEQRESLMQSYVEKLLTEKEYVQRLDNLKSTLTPAP